MDHSIINGNGHQLIIWKGKLQLRLLHLTQTTKLEVPYLWLWYPSLSVLLRTPCICTLILRVDWKNINALTKSSSKLLNERSSKGCLEKLKCFMTETGIVGSLSCQSTSSETLARERAYLMKDNDICLNLKLLSSSHCVSCNAFLGPLSIGQVHVWVLGLNLCWNLALRMFLHYGSSPCWLRQVT